MEEKLKQQLYRLYQTYSAINSQFDRIEKELKRLDGERSAISEVLNNTRELEKEIINNLNEITGTVHSTDDILEIIKSYE